MAEADTVRLLPATPDPARIAPFALRGLALLLRFLGDKADAPADFDAAWDRWKALPDRKSGKQAAKLGLKNLDRLTETVETACRLGASLPNSTRPEQKRRAAIGLLRLLARLDLIRSRRNTLPDPGEPIPMTDDEAGRLHARAIELLLRAAVNQSYADQALLVERVREWQSKVADKWLTVADDGDVLSGFDLKDLAALFVHVGEFPARYAKFYRDTPFLQLNGTDQRKTLELFLEDACEIRNRIAHHKRLTANQVALLNLYWDDVAIPMAEAHARHAGAAVDPAPFLRQDDRLAAWVAGLQRHAARTEQDSVFLREVAVATRAELGVVRAGVGALARHSRVVLVGLATLIVGVGLVVWQTGGLSPKLDRIQNTMKLETSADPRKELMNRGVQWDPESLLKAMQTGDVTTVALFLDGGMDAGVPFQGCNVLWYAIARGFAKAGPQIDLLARHGYDFDAVAECQPSASSSYTAAPLATAIFYRNGPVTDALLGHGVRVTTAMVAMLEQRPVAGTDYAQQYGPRLRDRLAAQGAGLPPADALRLRGLSVTPEGLVQAIRLGDPDTLHLFEQARTPVDQSAAFLAVAEVETQASFPNMLATLRRMGLDITARRKTQDYRDAEPQTLLTHAIRLRSDGAMRALLDAGATVMQGDIDALTMPYKVSMFSSAENEPGFPGRWRAELLRRRGSPATLAAASSTTPLPADPARVAPPIAAGKPDDVPSAPRLQTRMRANLRSGPSTSTPSTAMVDVATPVSLILPCLEGQTWCQVRTPDARQGWISTELLETLAGPGPVRGVVSAGQDTGWVTIGTRTFRLIGLAGLGGAQRQALADLLRLQQIQAECMAAEGAYSCHMGNTDLGGMIVAAGLAKAADKRFGAEQHLAQQTRRGMWAD